MYSLIYVNSVIFILSKKIPLILQAGDKDKILSDVREEIVKLTLVDADNFEIKNTISLPKKNVSSIVDELTIFIPLEALIEIKDKITRLTKEINKMEKKISANLKSDFFKRASKELVEKEKFNVLKEYQYYEETER